jgi:hypothetical protein
METSSEIGWKPELGPQTTLNRAKASTAYSKFEASERLLPQEKSRIFLSKLLGAATMNTMMRNARYRM